MLASGHQRLHVQLSDMAYSKHPTCTDSSFSSHWLYDVPYHRPSPDDHAHQHALVPENQLQAVAVAVTFLRWCYFVTEDLRIGGH